MLPDTSKASARGLILLGACLVIAFVLPFHLNPFRAFFNDWIAILGILVLAAYYAEDKFLSIQAPWITGVPVGLAVVIALQTAAGMVSEPWDSLLPVAYLILAALAIMLGASISAREQGAAKLCSVLATAHLVAALVSVVIASLQLIAAEIPFVPFMMLMPHEPGVPIRPHANLAQPNHLALLFCMAIASIWWLFQKGRVKPGMAIALVVSLLWGLVVTQSRIGWIIIPAFALAIYFFQRKAEIRPISGLLLIGFSFFYAALVVALPNITSMLNGTPTASVAARVMGGPSERMALFKQAWQISLAHPWFGAGWFQFGPQQVIGADLPHSIYSHHAHNIVLNFAAEIGWPLTIIFCGVFMFWFFRSCLSRSISTEIAFAILFFVAVLAHSMVEYPMWYAIVLLPLSLLIGMVHQTQFGSGKFDIPRTYSMIPVILMAAGLLGIGMDYRRVVAGFNGLEFGAMGMKRDEVALQKPAFTVFPYMYDYFRFLDMPVQANMSPEDIAFMEKVVRRFGGPIPLTRMSQVYAMNGREDDAVKVAFTVQRLHGARYIQLYENWRQAPAQYQNIFKRLPPPAPATAIKISEQREVERR